jgi:uncharacterized membrane protein HdeD (DUF308 family)
MGMLGRKQGSRERGYASKCAAQTREVAVKANRNTLRYVGIGLIVLGLLLVFLALPFWLWAVLLGVVLILAGFFLIIGD